jgi:hypothetical protein
MYKDKVLLIFDFAPLASVSVVAAESITVSLETVRNGGN